MNAKRTILLADDAAIFRELGSLYLARSGRVVTAEDGHQGLAAVRSERPSVVVADLDMPGMDGAELCRRIKADPETAAIPVILLTGTENGQDRERAVRAGADDVVAKPINRMALVQAVNRFLRDQPTRGLPRVALATPVRIVHPHENHWGTTRNISRGGIYVEAGAPMSRDAEVGLEFTLPEPEALFAPTAEVVWSREPAAGQPPGMGLRFLCLDRKSADRIDAFVHEHADLSPPPLAAAAGGS